MTVEERIAVLKLALREAQNIIRTTYLDDEYKVVAFEQVLNQLVYARIEEWGEAHPAEDGA